MEYTTLAAKLLESLYDKVPQHAYTTIINELQKEYAAHMLNDLVNAGDIYRAAEAHGMNVDELLN